MKKLLFVLTVTVLFASVINAQKKDGGKGNIKFGVKVGPNFGSWAGEDTDVSGDEKKKLKLGLHGGVFAVIPISKMLSFQPELLYSGQGVVYDDGDGTKYTYSTNHLNIPLGLRLQGGNWYGLLGPQVGFTLGGKLKVEYQGDEYKEDLEDLRGFIFSGIIGVGYAAPNGWGAYIRYARAFSSVFDFDDYKGYHSTLSLSFFYMLSMMKEKK